MQISAVDFVGVADGDCRKGESVTLFKLDAHVHVELQVGGHRRLDRDEGEDAADHEDDDPERSGDLVVRIPGMGQATDAGEFCEPFQD